uniref:Uncharacterized protein n=1 Tax=Rhizophora mucronata TaxID=61149 RepID=A0A2P2PPW4_RHIMU
MFLKLSKFHLLVSFLVELTMESRVERFR